MVNADISTMVELALLIFAGSVAAAFILRIIAQAGEFVVDRVRSAARWLRPQGVGRTTSSMESGRACRRPMTGLWPAARQDFSGVVWRFAGSRGGSRSSTQPGRRSAGA
jgi:hypothetical protein